MHKTLLATPLAVLLLLLLLGLPAVAPAAPGSAVDYYQDPPGDYYQDPPGSAVDQYQEHVPGAGGDRPSDGSGEPSGGAGGSLPFTGLLLGGLLAAGVALTLGGSLFRKLSSRRD